MSDLRRVVQDHWHALTPAGPSAPGRFAVTTLPVVTPDGPLSAAVDAEGRRHLLVPLASGQTLDADTRSAGVHLVLQELDDPPARRRYADLVLNDTRLSDVFTTLCADVVGAVAMQPASAVRVVRDVLSAWRSLLDAARVRLGPGGVTGLFAELVVLERLLARDPGAIKVWTGWMGTSRDFQRLGAGLEVKATTAFDGITFRVHGLDQLDPGPGRLWLAWFRLERHPEVGVTLPEMADRVLALTDDRRITLHALSRAGYDVTAREELGSTRFTVTEEKWFAVEQGFPRLVAEALVGGRPPTGVSDVHYTVDLAAAAVDSVDPGSVVASLLGE